MWRLAKGTQMKTNYVLIDYENVQPSQVGVLKGNDFKVMVFVGANQTKIPFELAAALQALGPAADYVKIAGNGPNALDFHIAYYIGKLAAADPQAYFHIISKDTGFDPLIRHLKANKILVVREKSLAEMTAFKISNATSDDERIDGILKSLIGRGQSRPRKVKTLSNTINALFQKTLGDKELGSIVDELKRRRLIRVDGESVTYRLPASG
jgi:hypothetical protein